ncbi:type I restriction endonuclease subunit R [Mycoplasma hafezii]|uniref:type I restriction endonuclease subunit R n=1 Tax=Mycoplasma hafezii TaxID=525886 RepID=UPI003CF8029F
MSKYDVLYQFEDSTVVAEYHPKGLRSDAYQNEAALENSFIKQLTKQGYEYLDIHTAKDLVSNLRIQLEKLNNIKFSDNEWDRLFKNHIAKNYDSIQEKTRRIQIDYIVSFELDDGSCKNIAFINKKNPQKNTLQVINQYEANNGTYKNRYDVTILVNGFPLVHIELKRRGVNIKEAFNQINRYQRESFWSDQGLFEYVQIFVISNGTETKYYSNTTRWNSIHKNAKSKFDATKKQTSNSFEFTSYWTDANNSKIADLVDFAKTFFSRHTLLNILTKYCVFDANQMLLVMRPYQIIATERIINRIKMAIFNNAQGTKQACGYIWHTTGSGKTLTSFKTAELATRIDEIDKVFFVVDRKDLDYQTIQEYNRFKENSTKAIKKTDEIGKLNDISEFHIDKIYVMTIQKLDSFVKNNEKHPIYNENIVFIYDECHRSHAGDMHKRISKKFKNYFFFGFTGTPIFRTQLSKSLFQSNYLTTEEVFGDKLHTYTIVDAIHDGNVLPFKIDYVNTFHAKSNIENKKVPKIDERSVLFNSLRISNVVSYILEHYNQKTKANEKYQFKRLENIAEVAESHLATQIKTVSQFNGFNSIFAVENIEQARLYYEEFKRQLPTSKNSHLKVATIFSYVQNKEPLDGLITDEDIDNLKVSSLVESEREFLERAISDYNQMFGTKYSTEQKLFQNYYKDVSLRMKNREIDILIVVNMFLTGFDSTTLNTLWVDKGLQMHGLIQAFSRTNRILNSIKTFGNIVCFRNIREATNQAIALFGNKDAKNIVVLREFKEYLDGYKVKEEGKTKYHPGYRELISEMNQEFPITVMQAEIVGEHKEKQFVKKFNEIIRLRNILTTFDDFEKVEREEIIAPIDLMDYKSIYLSLSEKYRTRREAEKEDVADDLIFEMELVRQDEVNIDYILSLIAKYITNNDEAEEKELKTQIDASVQSSPTLRNKKDLIDQFIEKVNTKPEENQNEEQVLNSWSEFIDTSQAKELKEIIEDENLDSEQTKRFIADCFRYGEIKTFGTDLDNLLPPVSIFSQNTQSRQDKKKRVVKKLKKFFDKFFGIFNFNNNK